MLALASSSVEKCDFAKDTQSGSKSASAQIARLFLDVLAARYWVVVGVETVGVRREGQGGIETKFSVAPRIESAEAIASRC
jgi:hypothetical protein